MFVQLVMKLDEKYFCANLYLSHECTGWSSKILYVPAAKTEFLYVAKSKTEVTNIMDFPQSVKDKLHLKPQSGSRREYNLSSFTQFYSLI